MKKLCGAFCVVSLLSGCGGETPTTEAAGPGQTPSAGETPGAVEQALSASACHISLLPKYNAQWKASLDKITTSGSQMAMASTTKSVTFTCPGGATATMTPTVDKIQSYPLELLADDYNYDISTPYAFGRFTNGCLAQNALAGQTSFGTLQNGSCNTSQVGNKADVYPRYFSTHYGSWSGRNQTQYLEVNLQTPNSGPGVSFVPILSGISVRSGAVDVYGSGDGVTWTSLATNVKGTASFNSISTKHLRFTSAGAAMGIVAAAPAAIDDIEVDFAKPETTVGGYLPRIVNLSYVAPGNASDVTYTAGSYTGSSASMQETVTESTSFAESVALAAVNVSDTYNYEISGDTVHDQFTTETGYDIQSTAENTGHGKDLFAIWLNAQVRDTMYFNGRPPVVTLWVPNGAQADIETATADQLTGAVAIPAYNTGLLALNAADRLALANADPFVANPNFDPATQPQRFGYYQTMVVDNSGDFAQGSVGGTTLALTWDHGHDVTWGSGQNLAWSVGLGNSIAWKDYTAASGAVSYSTTWDYTRSQTHTTGTTTTANVKLSSTNPCRHFTTKVYLDSLFNTYVFTPPGALPNGSPAGYICAAACAAGTPAMQDNTCECASDAQCPNSFCSLGTSYKCDTGAFTWTFDNNSTAGAVIAPYGANSSQPYIAYNAVMRSNALAVDFDKTKGMSVSVQIPIDHADLRGKRLTGTVLISGPAIPVDSDNGVTLNYGSTSGDSNVAYQYKVSTGDPYIMEGVIGSTTTNSGNGDPSDVTYVSVNVELTDVPVGFKGTIYIDNLKVTKN